MDSERTCRRCGDQVGYLSTDDLCDGCVAEQAAEYRENTERLKAHALIYTETKGELQP